MASRTDIEQRFWQRFAGRYDQFIARTLRDSYTRLFELLHQHVHPEDRVLEVATGTGLIALAIAGQVKEVEAVDLAPEMIRVAQEKQERMQTVNVRFSVQDICDLRFDPGAFDVAIASNVLHLLFYPEQALQEMGRVLAPGGRIIVPTFCHGEDIRTHFLSRVMGLAGFKARHRWSFGQFCQWVESCGYRITFAEKVQGSIPLAFVVAEKKEEDKVA